MEVRFTDAEYAAVRDAAAGPGRGVSLARFVAEAALAAAVGAAGTAGPGGAGRTARRAPSRVVSAVALAEVAAAVAALTRVGNNLNQLAREKNATGWRPVGAREVEQQALAALARLGEVADRAAGAGP